MAFNFLTKNDFSKMEAGKYEIDKSDIYALVQSYETKPKEKGSWEAHRRYLDIQYIVEGIELIGYAALGIMKPCCEYKEKEDYLLFEGKGDFFILRPKNFAIFLPQDVHMPGLAVTNPQMVKKVVVKVRVY